MIMATKNQTLDWRGFRRQARVQAARLEKQAAATRLVAMAEDPIDALATLWDLAAQERHAASARSARLHGRATPQAPAPVSRLLRGFTQQLCDKCVAVAELLDPDELARLAHLTFGFVAALEANDADVMLLIRDLLPREPVVIATWVRIHLDALEARFAP
jgi:hypothetical protein